jgi:hypothetical protein
LSMQKPAGGISDFHLVHPGTLSITSSMQLSQRETIRAPFGVRTIRSPR